MAGSRHTALVGDLRSVAKRVIYVGRPLLIIAVLWEVIAYAQLVPSQFFPHLFVIFSTITEMTLTGEIIGDAVATLEKVLAAFSLGVVTGTVIGLLMGRSKVVRWFFDPIVSVTFPFPKITLVPLFVLWFGTGSRPQILLGAFASAFPVIITTYAGTKNIPKKRIWSARSMGASETTVFTRIIFPSTLPSIFNGVQIALPISFIIIILTEMLVGADGLGELLMSSARFFRTPTQYAALISVAILGLGLDRTLRIVRTYLLRWSE